MRVELHVLCSDLGSDRDRLVNAFDREHASTRAEGHLTIGAPKQLAPLKAMCDFTIRDTKQTYELRLRHDAVALSGAVGDFAKSELGLRRRFKALPR